ncbi:hypothetical protein M5K25_000727 [Dendrobium thyrsiflorum]|uniref:SWIM-type domain-containing protein n=1 Tax=Dendrobium thyrsiflorum TaxID=117978 RepID=A0ABD0VUJ3_DENTH
MSVRPPSFMLVYDGELSLDDKFSPTYIGGKCRPLQVPFNSTLKQLKERVLRALKYDPSKFLAAIVARFPVGKEFMASKVEDDDACEFALSLAATELLILYVEVEEIRTECNFDEDNSTQIHDSVVVEHADELRDTTDRSIPVRNANLGYASRKYIVNYIICHKLCNRFLKLRECQCRSIHETYGINLSCPSTQSQHSPIFGLNDIRLSTPTIDDEGYETMSSGSSDDVEEDVDELVNDENVNINGVKDNINEFIREYCVRTDNTEEQMTVNNEYAEFPKSTRQWNAEVPSESRSIHSLTNDEYVIPNELVEHMCFRRKSELKFAIQGWSIINNVQFVVVASNRQKFTIECIQHDNLTAKCHWRLHASLSKRLGGVWKIATIKGQHTCTNPILQAGHRQCNSQFISFFIIPTIRKQMDIKPREIIGRVEAKFNIKVSYMKAWDSRRKAIKSVFGSWEESYRSLNLFMEAIVAAMPGTVYKIQSSSTQRFQRLFWAFGPSINGWKYCRPVLSLDGTFLLGKYRGTLLIAVGLDANNGLFPLAFGIVESECNESWIWFLRMLHELVPSISSRSDLCIISDRHAGLVRGCREIFPSAAHHHCLRHLRENFKKAVRQMGISDVEFVCQKMYTAGNTDDPDLFNQMMVDIIKIKPEIHQWLVERDLSKWTLIFDGGFRYGVMTTNASEAFNGILKRARGLPVQALITAIYYNIVRMFIRRLEMIIAEEHQSNNFFSARVQVKIRKLESDARRIPEPTRVNLHEFQVFDMSSRSYRVDITPGSNSLCSCGRTIIYHMPCAHVISCTAAVRLSHLEYVSEFYTLNNFKMTYADEFHTIPDKQFWPIHDPVVGLYPLTPPNFRRRSGRPKSTRYRNTMDERRHESSRVCSHCHMTGHNKTTCPARRRNH